MKNKIWLSSPHMGGMEQSFVKEAFDTNWISPVGPHLTAFEHELGAYLDMPHVAALSSGTAAIHLALIILGVGAGDEVLCSSFTFSATANPIVYLGAQPVFVDAERKTWNMDPELLRAAIVNRMKAGRKPKAIIVVHLYGMPAQWNELRSISNEFGIPIIEDAAEALGSTYDGKLAGTFGDFGVFSFNGNKIITTSGGGALVSRNQRWIEKARFLATQARDPAPHYEHSEIGYNYRLSNVSAAIGRGQLQVLPDRVRQRRANFDYYRRELSAYGIQFLPEEPMAFTNRWLTTILFNEKAPSPEHFRLALESENIESRPLWKPMHLQPVFRSCQAFANGVSEDIFSRGLCLPSGSNLLPDDLQRVVNVIVSNSK